MRTLFAIALLLIAPFGSAAEGAPVPPGIPVLGAHPKIWNFSVSPDGKHLAALESRGEEVVILVWEDRFALEGRRP